MHAALEYRALVVTNDEMRDHHFQMLAPRYFLRWKERHQVHFDFGTWVRDDQQNQGYHRQRPHREVKLDYPHVYSRRIQRIGNGNGLVVPCDKEYQDDAHEPGSTGEPVDETYLCVRIKKL